MEKRRTYAYEQQFIESQCPVTGNEDRIAYGLDLNHFYDALSSRQMEILLMLQEGYSQREVAEELGLNQATISRDLSQIRDKYEQIMHQTTPN